MAELTPAGGAASFTIEHSDLAVDALRMLWGAQPCPVCGVHVVWLDVVDDLEARRPTVIGRRLTEVETVAGLGADHPPDHLPDPGRQVSRGGGR